ncbi:glycosyl transferase family 8 [Haematococcus lacustris]|uniref:Glycosyl transferase family 8 n=1 Tax=Haematococcus lacustris TaxID=44745 RepID=A0A699ZB72_HAELA|nr:glycosyl transferase family 8 [Haematococcus lacustris]
MKLARDTRLHSLSSRRAHGAVAHWPLSRKLLWLVCSVAIGASLYTYISDIQLSKTCSCGSPSLTSMIGCLQSIVANVKIQIGEQAARAAPIWFSLGWIQHYSAAGHGIKFTSPSQEDERFVWIFTYNDQSSSYDSMMQAAVTSAIEVGHLRPFCLYSGSETSPVYHWLADHGVTLVYNAKPYQSCVPDAMLLHLHGPKPADYERFYTMGECRFGEMCRQGLAGCLCKYLLASSHSRASHPALTLLCDTLLVNGSTISNNDASRRTVASAH